MKKLLITMSFVVTFFVMGAVSASALANDTIKVGLYYGDTAQYSANLENAVGSGYEFGYFDANRVFCALGETERTAISVTAAGGDIYMDANGDYSPVPPAGAYTYLGPWHVQISNEFSNYQTAKNAADSYQDAWPAWINGAYVVRMGGYRTESEAAAAAAPWGGKAVKSSGTSVIVTVVRTNDVLFEFDHSGTLSLGVNPDGKGQSAATFLKAKKYPGAFEFRRSAGANMSAINVLPLEEYIKGVIPYEMSPSWPMAALEAQAICARTYASRSSRHLGAHGFDVCNTTDCQVYHGLGSGYSSPNERTNAAVDNTRGMLLYYEGDMIQNAVYHASSGGATENVANVWGSYRGYLVGKLDPYEAQTSVPAGYTSWTVTFTAEELTNIMAQKGHNIGTVKNVYVSKVSPTGNAIEVTFEGTNGTKSFFGESGRVVFYSSTYGKSVKSMRFTIAGGGGEQSGTPMYISGSTAPKTALEGLVALGAGGLSKLGSGSVSVISSEGTFTVMPGTGSVSTIPEGHFVITGSGSGHNLGMSQYGAKAMAELGFTYEDILKFYYTGITIQRANT